LPNGKTGGSTTLVKSNRWIDIAEYVSLVGVGVGSVASLVSSQVLYTSAPLSLLALLNIANRKRLEAETQEQLAYEMNRLGQNVAGQVLRINQQLSQLPTPETMSGLRRLVVKNNRDLADHLAAELRTLQSDIYDRISDMESHSVQGLRSELGHVQTRYGLLADHLTQLNTQWQDFVRAGKVEGLERAIAQIRQESAVLQGDVQRLADYTKPNVASLQDQLNQLNRQFQKLPPPFDATALRQDVTELIRLVQDLVPRRDWLLLQTELQLLQQQQESQAQAEETLWRKIQDINQQLQYTPTKDYLAHLQQQIHQLSQQVQHLPPPFDLTSLHTEIQTLLTAVANRVPKRDLGGLVAQVNTLQHQQAFQTQVEAMLRQELTSLNQQLQALLQDSPSGAAAIETRLPQQEFQSRLEQLLRVEFAQIGRQLQTLPAGAEFQVQVAELLHRELQSINQQLYEHPVGPHYEFVLDLPVGMRSRQSQMANPDGRVMHSSRSVLEEALELTEERLIVVLPWSGQTRLDPALLEKMEAFLQRGGRLDLGWCQQAERRTERFLAPINQRWQIYPPHKVELQDTLKLLLGLKRSHPETLQFKILGARENFLVSDYTYCVIGVDEDVVGLSTLPDMPLKLKTSDMELVQQLIQRFNNATLDADDIAAYWNRAITRLDLGDRPGALADFDHIVQHEPEDAIAHNVQGVIRFDSGDVDGAIDAFNRSLHLAPRQVAAYCNRGYVRADRGDRVGALADFTTAIQMQPRAAVAYFFRAMTYQQQGELDKAIADYNEALRFSPNSAPAYYYRGLARPRTGDMGGAIADLDMALDLFTQQGHEANARKAFNSLQTLRSRTPAAPAPSTVATCILDAEPFSFPDSAVVYERHDN
jgi:tetratricopeptide (TPR) repeat protein